MAHADTVSTHSIARSGVVQLRRWGLLDEVLDSGAPAIRQVTFNAAGESTTRTIKDKAGVDFLVAPRRYVLDTLLATAAEHAGAEVRPGVTVTGLQRDGRGRVVGVDGHDRAGAPVGIDARWVIGADGLRSQVARSVGAAINEAGQAGGAVQYAYYAGIPWSGIEFFVAERSFAGVFPTHDSQAFSGLLRVVGTVGRPAGMPPLGGAPLRSSHAGRPTTPPWRHNLAKPPQSARAACLRASHDRAVDHHPSGRLTHPHTVSMSGPMASRAIALGCVAPARQGPLPGARPGGRNAGRPGAS